MVILIINTVSLTLPVLTSSLAINCERSSAVSGSFFSTKLIIEVCLLNCRFRSVLDVPLFNSGLPVPG